jgi:hypothetical protein
MARWSLSLLIAALAITVTGCGLTAPRLGDASLPSDFPADFPAPPSAKLLSATGPLPFVPAEARGFAAEWSSSLSRAELEAFYTERHGAWRLQDGPIAAPSVGPLPISLPAMFILVHDVNGAVATVSVGVTTPGVSGTVVFATIIPRPSPSPTAS